MYVTLVATVWDLKRRSELRTQLNCNQFQGMVFQVFECHSCYALIPYLGCRHNCPAAYQEEDEGFEEVPGFLINFIRILAYCRRHQLEVVVVEAPLQPAHQQ